MEVCSWPFKPCKVRSWSAENHISLTRKCVTGSDALVTSRRSGCLKIDTRVLVAEYRHAACEEHNNMIPHDPGTGLPPQVEGVERG